MQLTVTKCIAVLAVTVFGATPQYVPFAKVNNFMRTEQEIADVVSARSDSPNAISEMKSRDPSAEGPSKSVVENTREWDDDSPGPAPRMFVSLSGFEDHTSVRRSPPPAPRLTVGRKTISGKK